MTDTAAMVSGSAELEGLLKRMAIRDEGAFEKLYVATKRKIFSTVVLIVKRRHLAEEVVQEAYVQIWLNAAQYKPSIASPMVWMMAIARNRAIDMARKPVREMQSDDTVLFNFPADGPTALEAIEISEDQMMRQLNLLYALQALDPTRRHLIIAAYIRGESRKQLSERYGVPVNTIKTWIRRALLDSRVSLQNIVVASPS